MAQATQHHNRFHNLSNEALADAISGPLANATRAVITRMRALVTRDPKNALLNYASPTIGTPLQTLSLRHALPEFASRIDASVDAVPALALPPARAPRPRSRHPTRC